ncbi:VC0807 family protein [Actinokineospora enzanensis]|uniref:VC0807 family protein n=1 Tax=Actinokineospora enzanensis TaxID=155975 RepID=UPI000380460C|nr:VC0807 family protein [Actinokineospora enzanensis]
MSGPATDTTGARTAPTIGDRVKAVAAPLLLDLVLPYAIYLVLTALDVPVVVALTAGGLVPAGRAAVHWRRTRSVDLVAVAIAGLFLLGAVFSAITGDPRFAVAKESLLTGAGGLFCLATLAMRRPAMFFVRQRFSPFPPRAWDRAWTGSTALRRDLRVLTAAWGVGLLVEAAGLLVLVYTEPVDKTAAIAPLANIGVIVLLVTFTHAYTFLTRRNLDVAAMTDGA